jgi:hypothetical protein
MNGRCRMRKGSRHVVCGYRRGGHFRRRLMDMGFTPGTEFRVVKETPLAGLYDANPYKYPSNPCYQSITKSLKMYN